MSGDKWCIKYGDLVLYENDLTIGQAERIEKMTDLRWHFINPLRSAVHALAVGTVMIADASGRTEDVVAAELRNTKVSDWLDAVELVSDDVPTVFEDGNPQ